MLPPQTKVWLRLPLIPGFNDSRENLTELSRLGQEIGVEKVSILPYHRLAEEKYRQLGMRRKMPRIEPPSPKRLQEIQALIESFGLQVTFGS